LAPLPSLPPERPSTPIGDTKVGAKRTPAAMAATADEAPADDIAHARTEELSASAERDAPVAAPLPPRPMWPMIALGLGAALVVGAIAYTVSGPDEVPPAPSTTEPIATPKAREEPPPREEPRVAPPGVDPPPP